MNPTTAGPSDDVSDLLSRARGGDEKAFDLFYAAVYGELRRVAHRQRISWNGNYTLNTTALVHETYLKLVRQDQRHWSDRAHFFGVAARAMRQILADYAERHRSLKRGGDRERVELDEARDTSFNPVPAEHAEELIGLHEALQRLESENSRQCRVVECRVFAGLPVQETARVLGVSPATVKRDWKAACDWLHQELRVAS